MRTGCQGVVKSFDSPVGMGVVGEEDPAGSTGVAEYSFHCSQIADGSREIAAGTPVTFDVVAAGPGRWEAANLRATG